MSALTLMGGYWTARAAAREFAVARLQADFVSAVSHEFRTPLTLLRQLSELLASGTTTSEDRRRRYYDVLARESARLHRLVEGLHDIVFPADRRPVQREDFASSQPSQQPDENDKSQVVIALAFRQ